MREKLVKVEQECKLGKINSSAADQQKVSLCFYILYLYIAEFSFLQMEILTALRQLGEQLSQVELQFLEQNRETLQAFNNIEFVQVKDDDM